MIPNAWVVCSILFIPLLAYPTIGRHTDLSDSYEYVAPCDKTGFSKYNSMYKYQSSNSPNRGFNYKIIKNDKDEYGNFVEGDMIMSDMGRSRTGLRSQAKKWPNKTMVYEIIGDFTPPELCMIKEAMRIISTRTCIRFKARDVKDKHYVGISREHEGCFARVGVSKNRGPQRLNLNPSCFYQMGKILHEILHALGVLHEHTRPDRDLWVKINLKYVKEESKPNFKKRTWKEVTAFKEKYDYDSVMHYDGNAFAIDEDDQTIIPRVPGVVIGQRERLSKLDVRKLNKMYKCKS